VALIHSFDGLSIERSGLWRLAGDANGYATDVGLNLIDDKARFGGVLRIWWM